MKHKSRETSAWRADMLVGRFMHCGLCTAWHVAHAMCLCTEPRASQLTMRPRPRRAAGFTARLMTFSTHGRFPPKDRPGAAAAAATRTIPPETPPPSPRGRAQSEVEGEKGKKPGSYSQPACRVTRPRALEMKGDLVAAERPVAVEAGGGGDWIAIPALRPLESNAQRNIRAPSGSWTKPGASTVVPRDFTREKREEGRMGAGGHKPKNFVHKEKKDQKDWTFTKRQHVHVCVAVAYSAEKEEALDRYRPSSPHATDAPALPCPVTYHVSINV
ncbi:hypothetical protein B0I35DRAFT_212713 [Stachybotrys elegans]|uniref:Uncharacterized protein n=1 Tax=Stachybotrys elegans TaxID=80388 RepID=A0A8K0WSJ3_9HYPO|nr:hypothetical protein B0I35DRAFT_212713 [Stachybotrys elegans]